MAEWSLHGLGGWLLMGLGLVFFIAGSAGLVRFPDACSRLHALTKADTLGLGLVVAGLAWHGAEWGPALQMLLIWLLLLLSSATTCQILARQTLEEDDHG